jgi:hypothetical protein
MSLITSKTLQSHTTMVFLDFYWLAAIYKILSEAHSEYIKNQLRSLIQFLMTKNCRYTKIILTTFI